MHAILICPTERPELSVLSKNAPLSNLNIFGRPLLHHWLEYLAECGAVHVKLLAVDRPADVRKIVGNGARWGLQVEVLPETHELTCDEARKKFCSGTEPQTSHKVVLIDHLPGLAEQKLFESYKGFFEALQCLLKRRAFQTQIGLKEFRPGVWVGLRTQISPRAEIVPPCWIGENVLVKPDAMIGPGAIIESGAVIESGATIYDSWIGPQTFTGALVQVQDSLALGNTLVNFRLDSVTTVPDAFLLSALETRRTPVKSSSLASRAAALLALALTSPFALATILKSKWQGQRPFRMRRAAPPKFSPTHPITYYEFANVNGWWKRWPQLWNVVRGDFAWIGNRPLSPIAAGELANDFEKLWLAAPIGLISQGDAEGCHGLFSDEARAHASFYAVQSNWRLDCAIFFRALKRALQRKPFLEELSAEDELKSRAVDLGRVAIR